MGGLAGRDQRGRWAKGRSGNPGGRVGGVSAEVRREAAKYAQEALVVLLGVMRQTYAPPAVRRQAARDLLRLALGTAPPPLAEARELLKLAGLTELPAPPDSRWALDARRVSDQAPAPRRRVFLPPR